MSEIAVEINVIPDVIEASVQKYIRVCPTHIGHSIGLFSSGVTNPSKGKIGHSIVPSTKSYYSHRERIQKNSSTEDAQDND